MRFLVLLAFLLLSAPALARPPQGFFEGPYLALAGGLLQIDWDVNRRTGTEEGRKWEPMIHLGFGWNVTDWFAPELDLRFNTDRNAGRREYFVGAHFGPAFTLLLDPLLNFKSLRILPFVKPAFAFQAASLPGDTAANDNRVTDLGMGFALSGGVRFLLSEYFFFGIEAQEDFIYHPDKSQMISGTSTLIYPGGLKRQFEGRVMVGVHF